MADVVGRHLLKTSPADVYAGSPPLGFTFGLGALLVFPLRFRAATAPIEAPAPAAVLAAIEKHGVTCLFTAPIAYRALAAELAGRNLASLKRCVSAGEFLPKGREMRLTEGRVGVHHLVDALEWSSRDSPRL